MEEICWKQFWETGKVTDYLIYKNSSLGDMNTLGKEETRESDYSDRDGAGRISF